MCNPGRHGLVRGEHPHPSSPPLFWPSVCLLSPHKSPLVRCHLHNSSAWPAPGSAAEAACRSSGLWSRQVPNLFPGAYGNPCLCVSLCSIIPS